jgi:hypothetical protein
LLITAYADGPIPSGFTAADASLTGSLTRNRVKQWIDGRGRPLNMRRLNSARITERLAIRVKGLQGDYKGLTAVFCVLLLTNPARTPPPGGLSSGVAAAAKSLLVTADR